VVTADDVSEPVKVNDDVTVAEMSELDSRNADNLSTVIGLDNTTSVVSNVETSAQPAIDNNSIVVSAATVNDTVECSTAERAVGTQAELISSSPSKLVIDTSSNADDDCDMEKALKAENVDTVDTDTRVVCDTIDETSCDPVVSQSLPPSSDMSVTFPITSTEVGKIVSGGDDSIPGDMQLDVAECVEIGDAAD